MRRRIAFAAALVVLVLGICEGSARLLFRHHFGRPWSPAQALEQAEHPADPWQAGGLDGDEPRAYVGDDELIHPFIGFYVHHADGPPEALGMRDGVAALRTPRQDGQVRVAVVGGSVADALGERLRHDLSQRYPADRVAIANLAVGGGKQPQQLMTVTWLLAMGAEFDVIVDVSGTNEVVLPFTDNLYEGSHPAWPRGWATRVRGQPTPQQLRMAGRIVNTREQRDNLRRWAATHPLGFSALLGFWVEARIEGLDHQADLAEQALRDADAAGPSAQATGPRPASTETEAVMDQAIALWFHSAATLAGLARANDAVLVEVLQPSQYLSGSKPLSDWERRRAMHPELDRGRIDGAFPRLQALGNRLEAEHGAIWLDATGVFVDQPDTRYADSCCHLNEHGNAELSALVIDTLVGRGLLPSG